VFFPTPNVPDTKPPDDGTAAFAKLYAVITAVALAATVDDVVLTESVNVTAVGNPVSPAPFPLNPAAVTVPVTPTGPITDNPPLTSIENPVATEVFPMATPPVLVMYIAGVAPATNDATGCAVVSIWLTTRAGPVPKLLITTFELWVSYALIVSNVPSTEKFDAFNCPDTDKLPVMLPPVVCKAEPMCEYTLDTAAAEAAVVELLVVSESVIAVPPNAVNAEMPDTTSDPLTVSALTDSDVYDPVCWPVNVCPVCERYMVTHGQYKKPSTPPCLPSQGPR